MRPADPRRAARGRRRHPAPRLRARPRNGRRRGGCRRSRSVPAPLCGNAPGHAGSACGTGSRTAAPAGSGHRLPSSVRSRCRESGRAPARPTAARGCRDGAASANSVRLGASSTILPRYITATRSRDVLHHGEVVGDEQVGEAELALQVLQQVEDLRLDRHVERRDRLVADDELRLERERAGDADALALPAGEFVRIAQRVLGRRGRPGRSSSVDRARRSSAPRRGRARRSGSARMSPTRHARVERRVGVLEDDLHVAGAARAALAAAQRVTSLPSKRIVPAVGSIRRSTRRPVVDLPQPDSPTSASVSPRSQRRTTGRRPPAPRRRRAASTMPR